MCFTVFCVVLFYVHPLRSVLLFVSLYGPMCYVCVEFFCVLGVLSCSHA